MSDQNDLLRQKIRDVARKKFFTLGIKSVTMDDIAQDAGIGKATLYEQFPSKNALVEEIVREKVLEMEKYLNEVKRKVAEDDNLDLINEIRNLISFGSREFLEIKEPFAVDVAKLYHDLAQGLEYSILIREIVVEIMVRGRRQGIIRPDFNQDVVIDTILLIVHQVITNRELALRYNISSSEVLDTIMRLLMAGLLTDSARARFEI